MNQRRKVSHLQEEPIGCFDSNAACIIRVSQNRKRLQSPSSVRNSYYVNPIASGVQSHELVVKHPEVETSRIDPPQLQSQKTPHVTSTNIEILLTLSKTIR